MGKKGDHYTKKLKVKTVRLVVEEGQWIFEVARDIFSDCNHEDFGYA